MLIIDPYVPYGLLIELKAEEFPINPKYTWGDSCEYKYAPSRSEHVNANEWPEKVRRIIVRIICCGMIFFMAT